MIWRDIEKPLSKFYKKFVLHRNGYNHFANLLFYKIYTLILFNDLERHREASLQFYNKFVLHRNGYNHFVKFFFTKYIQ